jgi:uncharacterized damage-inducible protein DinB
MTAADLRIQFDYGYWANARLFAVASNLTTEQFTQPVSGSYGSIRNTLVHMMSTEWGWMERSGGFRRGPKLSASDFPTFASVREKWEQIEAHVRSFLDTLQDEDLHRVVEFSLGEGPKQALSVGEMMHHAAIHGVHHRGQVALLLRSLGYVPGDFDMLFYYRQLRQC